MTFNWFRFLRGELRYVRSWKSARNLYNKSPFFLKRLTGITCQSSALPLSLQLEVTNHCNISCTCCPRDRLSRPKGFMDLDLFQKLIREAADLGIKRAHLYLHGEPFLHPKLVPMIEYAKLKDLGVSLATNGMLLDRAMGKKILEAGMDNADHIMFSLLGHSKEVHEKVMRGVQHERVVDNILNFIDLRDSTVSCGPLVETVMYNMPENSKEKREYINFWQGFVDHVRWMDTVAEQYSSFQKEKSRTGRTVTCKNLWQRLTVLWNGDVTICCADLNGTQVFGNVREQGIAGLWNHEKLVHLRQMHKERRFGEVPMCGTCDWE